MLRRLQRFGLGFALFALTACSGKRTPSYNPAIGPFDEDGNYIEAWADNPPDRNRRSQPAPPPAPPVVSAPQPVRSASPPPPKTVSRPKPKPKPTPKPKPKPAPKPKTISHTVKKGDTLYGLSRRYGVSVSAIQKANGLRGTIIRTGSTIKIPR